MALHVAHSPDFRSVQLLYSFTPTQAAIIELLWEAAANGAPEVGLAYLNAQLECRGYRKEDCGDTHPGRVFTDHPAYRAFLIPGQSAGSWRLHEELAKIIRYQAGPPADAN